MSNTRALQWLKSLYGGTDGNNARETGERVKQMVRNDARMCQSDARSLDIVERQK